MRTQLANYSVILLFIVTILCLLLSGCGVLTTLQTIVDATSAAVPILEAAGVPIPPAVPLYVAAVADCIGNANTTNPTTAELVQIAGCLATQIAPVLPPGTPEAVDNIIAAIIKDVAAFISQHDVQKLKASGAAVPLSPREKTQLLGMIAKAKLTSIHARKLVHP